MLFQANPGSTLRSVFGANSTALKSHTSKEKMRFDGGGLRREAEDHTLDSHGHRPIEELTRVAKERGVKASQRDCRQEVVEDDVAHVRVAGDAGHLFGEGMVSRMSDVTAARFSRPATRAASWTTWSIFG